MDNFKRWMGSYHPLESQDSTTQSHQQSTSSKSKSQRSSQDSLMSNVSGAVEKSQLFSLFGTKPSKSRESHCHETCAEVGNPNAIAKRRLIIASIMCLIFMISEVVGGVWANSLAIVTDAAHLLTDFGSFLISLVAIWISTYPATRQMNFGWQRAEVIGALLSVLLIWVVTGILVYMAIERCVFQNFQLESRVMLISAFLAIIFNLMMAFVLGHHGHSHSGAARPANDKKNINLRAAFIHVIGDLLQSLGVFIGALLIYFMPTWIIIDPICTFIFSVFVLITTISILREILQILMEGAPLGMDFVKIYQTLYSLPGVVKVHNLRIWSLSLNKTALSAHIAIDLTLSEPLRTLKLATRRIVDEFGIRDITLQVEEYKKEMQECHHCRIPI